MEEREDDKDKVPSSLLRKIWWGNQDMNINNPNTREYITGGKHKHCGLGGEGGELYFWVGKRASKESEHLKDKQEVKRQGGQIRSTEGSRTGALKPERASESPCEELTAVSLPQFHSVGLLVDLG